MQNAQDMRAEDRLPYIVALAIALNLAGLPRLATGMKKM